MPLGSSSAAPVISPGPSFVSHESAWLSISLSSFVDGTMSYSMNARVARQLLIKGVNQPFMPRTRPVA